MTIELNGWGLLALLVVVVLAALYMRRTNRRLFALEKTLQRQPNWFRRGL